MSLSNIEIEKALKRRSLIIKPRPAKKRITTNTVDVRLGRFLYVLKDPGKPLFFDPTCESIQDFWEKNGKKIDLCKLRSQRKDDPDGNNRDHTGYWLAPGEICLAFTHERIELPIDGEQLLQGEIWNRSRTARAFVHTHISAPQLKPGTNNCITLEIHNSGHFYFRLTYLQEIAQIAFDQVQGRVRASPSDFHGQTSPSGVRVKK